MQLRAETASAPVRRTSHARRGRTCARSWGRFLRHARHGIRHARALIHEFVEHPDLRGFTGNVDLVCAEVALEQVADDLCEIADRIADAPEKVSPGPRLLSAMGDQWAETVKLLADVTIAENPPNFEYDALSWFDTCFDVGLWVGLIEPLDRTGMPTLADLLTIEHPRLPIPAVRRRQFAPAAFAETPRRISRGRAPPSLDLSSL